MRTKGETMRYVPVILAVVLGIGVVGLAIWVTESLLPLLGLLLVARLAETVFPEKPDYTT